MAPAHGSHRALRAGGSGNGGPIRVGEHGGPWSRHAELAHALLGEDASSVLAAVCAAAHDGASCEDLGRSLAYAAALRVARFGTANEHGDWETAHHVFTNANALHRMLERIGSSIADGDVSAVRGVLHGVRGGGHAIRPLGRHG